MDLGQPPVENNNLSGIDGGQLPPVQPNNPPMSAVWPGMAVEQDKKMPLWVLIAIIAGTVVLTAGVTATVMSSLSGSATEKARLAAVAAQKKEEERREREAERLAGSGCVSAVDLQKGFEYLGDDAIENFSEINDMTSSYIFFEPGTSKSRFEETNKSAYDLMANFYKNHTRQKFVYNIIASTTKKELSEADKKLADSRSKTVRDELLGRGLPQERVTVNEVHLGVANPELDNNITITLSKSGECRFVEKKVEE